MDQFIDPEDWYARDRCRIQAIQPHKFILKLKRHAFAGGWAPTSDAANIGVQQFSAMYSAAEFAWHCGLSLDICLTVDFARMGIFEEAAVRRELNKVLKNYSDWCTERGYSNAWLYSVEMTPGAEDGYHAHIALFVPEADAKNEAAKPRSEFKTWVKGYTARNFKRHIPRAIVARGGSKMSAHRHWRVVTYLLKGFDPGAIVQSARSTPDGLPVYLHDLIPWPYCNPGPVGLAQRVRVSHSLGPKRREIGVATGLDHLLPHRPNWKRFRVDGRYDETSDGFDEPDSLPIPQPFRSRFEDGIRDVRNLYPPDFYRYVTRQDAFPQPPVDEIEERERARQLGTLMYD